MKAVSLIVQFVIFFTIGLGFFLLASNLFRFQSNLIRQDILDFGSDFSVSQMSAFSIKAVDSCKSCDSVSIKIDQKSIAGYNPNYQLSNGIVLSIEPENKILQSSIHNLYYSINIPFSIIYTSQNLNGHSVSDECNPGGGTSCLGCSVADVSITSFAGYGAVTSNVNQENIWVNAIGNKKFIETLPNGQPVQLATYKYKFSTRLPVLPRPDVSQQQNPDTIHLMILLYDGKNQLGKGAKISLEAVLLWKLNPWSPDYGKLYIYVPGEDIPPPEGAIGGLKLEYTGLTIPPDTNWHTFELEADFQNERYITITADSQRTEMDFPVPKLSRPSWGSDTTIILTTESMATHPGDLGCSRIFYWTQEFRNIEFSEPKEVSSAKPITLTYDRIKNELVIR